MNRKLIVLTEDGILLCPLCGKEVVAATREYYENVPVTLDPDSLRYDTSEGPGDLECSEVTSLYCNKTEGCYWSAETTCSVEILHPSGDIV